MSDDGLRAARERLRALLPALRLSREIAKRSVPDGKITLGVCGKRPDGSGEKVCDFEFDPFLEDLEMILGVGIAEKEENINNPTAIDSAFHIGQFVRAVGGRFEGREGSIGGLDKEDGTALVDLDGQADPVWILLSNLRAV